MEKKLHFMLPLLLVLCFILTPLQAEKIACIDTKIGCKVYNNSIKPSNHFYTAINETCATLYDYYAKIIDCDKKGCTFVLERKKVCDYILHHLKSPHFPISKELICALALYGIICGIPLACIASYCLLKKLRLNETEEEDTV